VRLARLHLTPFTDRLVTKFGLPVTGWRGRVRQPSRPSPPLADSQVGDGPAAGGIAGRPGPEFVPDGGPAGSDGGASGGQKG
jgi:NAD+ kinase